MESTANRGVPKALTGIDGLDEITHGGLPVGRPTLVCGSAGCGKTVFGLTFLVNGATQYGEPGVFMSFEERAVDLVANVRSLGYDLDALMAERKLAIDQIAITRGEFEESGEYDLEGLFVRLDYAIRSVNAKRVVLDTIETLFSAFPNEAVMRSELVRLFTWIKDRGITAIVTGERGNGTLTRHGLEEYVSDCVIVLDHRVDEQISTRRLRIVKYRGSAHGTNEYPFLVDEQGITVVPITSMGLDHKVSNDRISTGIPRLDVMLGGEGYYRGTSVLVGGTAGTGKSTLAAHFVDATCRRGERAVMFAFEESPAQIVRNMKSVGIDLKRWQDEGLLQIHAARPMLFGLEMHLVQIYRIVEQFEPSAVVMDPISNLIKGGSLDQASAMVLRLVDYLKSRSVTALYTNLNYRLEEEQTDIGISSLMDTWLLLRDFEVGGERNRGMHVLKARGIAHSNQVREYRITKSGIEVLDVSLGSEGVLTGSARLAQEARLEAQQRSRERENARRKRELERRRAIFQAQVAQLQADFAATEEELLGQMQEAADIETQFTRDREAMAVSRNADAVADDNGKAKRGTAHRKGRDRS